MTYSVEIKESAEEEIQSLDNSKQEEILSQLEKLEDYPEIWEASARPVERTLAVEIRKVQNMVHCRRRNRSS